MAKKIKLGEKYRDTVSGFEGTAVSRSEFLNGCVRYGLLGLSKDGGEPPELVFDEQQLEEVKTGRKPAATASTGGPRHRTPAPRTGTR